jgi:hypothetical protein
MPVCKIEEGTLEYASPPGWAQHRNRRWLIGLKVKQHKIGLPSHYLADTDGSKPFHQLLTEFACFPVAVLITGAVPKRLDRGNLRRKAYCPRQSDPNQVRELSPRRTEISHPRLWRD